METMSLEYALFATQRALLGIITPELRAVVIDICKEEDLFYIRFYHDGQASEKRIDLWECAMTEASAALGIDCVVDGFVIRLDYPQKIPLRGRYAYLRKEGANETFPVVSKEYLKVRREVIDFKKPIGLFSNPVDLEEMPTDWGVIHHAGNSQYTIPAKPESYKIGVFPLAYAQLALQRALLGKVTPALRNVIADVNQEDKLLYIRFFYDGEVSNEMLNHWEWTISLTFADVGQEYTLDAAVERVDYPQNTLFRGRYAYRREEERTLCPVVSKEHLKVRREVIDFKTPIGFFIKLVKFEGIPTDWGVIHHAGNVHHLIPAKPEKDKIDIFPLAYALLALQRALLEKVTPALRNVIADVNQEDKLFYIRFFYDGEVSNEILNLWEWAISLAFAGVSQEYTLDAAVERLDYPQNTLFRGRYAYLRKEGARESIPVVSKKYLKARREVIDFKKPIGLYIHPVDLEEMSTNWGVIHYAGNSHHIIPAKPNDKIAIFPLAYASLALQRALLGKVTPALRNVMVDINQKDKLLYTGFFYDGEVPNEILNHWEWAISLAFADVSQEYTLDAVVERVDYPQYTPFRGQYAYMRKE